MNDNSNSMLLDMCASSMENFLKRYKQ